MDWLDNVQARLLRKNQILFTRESLCLADLTFLLQKADRQTVIAWALHLAQEAVCALQAKYPSETRPAEAVSTSQAWAAGQIKMPMAKPKILACHALAKELSDPVDIALCHAIGQACSVVHTVHHAIGFPIYELTAIVRQTGLDHCRPYIEDRIRHYHQILSAQSSSAPSIPHEEQPRSTA